MADPTRERPAIHVCLAGPAQPGLSRWVEVGAEEEGLPTRHVALLEDDVVAAAFAAAQGSRFGVGVAIGQGRVVLHEAHMPPAQPVLSFELAADAPRACRLMGGNAARMVVRLPLRLADEIAAGDPQITQMKAAGQGKAAGQDGATAPAAEENGPEIGEICGPTANGPEIGAICGQPEVARVAAVVARILRERGIL